MEDNVLRRSVRLADAGTVGAGRQLNARVVVIISRVLKHTSASRRRRIRCSRLGDAVDVRCRVTGTE